MDVILNGNRVRLSDELGEGGEATVYWLDGSHSTVAKVYKPPDHPDFSMQPDGPQSARDRIDEHQAKLPEIISKFSRDLARIGGVVVPRDVLLATGRSKRIVGYTMDAVADAMPLTQLSRPAFRKGDAVPNHQVVRLFLQMSSVVDGVHGLGVVVGDFNEANVLAVIQPNSDPVGHFIDVDSWQFPGFRCRMFTLEFVDPLLCDPSKEQPDLMLPHTPESDVYALNCMLFRSLLLVDPFGGVYRPNGKHDKAAQRGRKMRRISVLHEDVGVPNWALHYGVLPDELLDHFLNVFERDERGPFPVKLIEDMRWTRCSVCGAIHARNRCPQCDKAVGIVTEVSRGEITIRQIFSTGGTILVARSHNGVIAHLQNRQDGAFVLEDGSVLFTGKPLPRMRFRMSNRATYVGSGNKVIEFPRNGERRQYTVDSYEGMPSFDVNSTTFFWTFSNVLYRSNDIGGQVPLTSVLSGRTLFWVGEEFGLATYRAGEIQRTFIFGIKGTSTTDVDDVPRISGHLVDSKCFFSRSRCWMLQTVSEGGRTFNRCTCISQHGQVLGVAEADEGDGSWLGNIRGKVASKAGLLSASDEGLVMVVPDAGRLEVSAHFGDTEDLVHPGCGLQPGDGGSLFVIDRQRISLLTFNRRRDT